MAVLKILKAVGSKIKNKLQEKERKRKRKPTTPPKDSSPGQSAFSSPENLKTTTGQPGKRKPRTKTQKESTTARRMADKEATAKAANVETGKKVLKGAALVGAGAVGGYAAGKSEDSDKPKTDKSKDDKSKRTNQQLDAFVRDSNKRRSKDKTQPEKLKEQLKGESSGDRVERSNPPKRATVTGKKDDMASRNISNDGKKQANVTREQLERLGLDPKKKSSLTTYLNAYDRLGRRPKSKADLAAKKNMGGMMKKKEAPSRPTGYMDGGMATKTSARGKPKGVGAATGGYGRAMR